MTTESKAVSLLLLSVFVGHLTYHRSVLAEETYEWPDVAPLNEHFDFEDLSTASVKLAIDGSDGEPLYFLECHPGDYEDDLHRDYSGDFQCKLARASHERSEILLSSDPFQSNDWQTRARFVAEELWGSCWEYPEYGHKRTFRLRGMEIVLIVGDIVFKGAPSEEGLVGEGNLGVRSLSLDVGVRPDSSALSAIPEPVPFAEPLYRLASDPSRVYRKCDTVVSNHVPGMADETFIKRHGLGAPYPLVVKAEKEQVIPSKPSSFQFAVHPLEDESMTFYLPIYDVRGVLTYEFECSAYVSATDSRILVGRWGISCGLFQVGKLANLLDDSVDPYSRISRAHILPRHLAPECQTYPEWGAIRKFKLRGMSLEIKLSDPLFAGPDGLADFFLGGIQQVRMKVTALPDSSATSPVATSAPFSDWSFLPSCTSILLNPIRSGESDVTGDFCTSGNERESTEEDRWYADQEVQAGTDRNAAAAD